MNREQRRSKPKAQPQPRQTQKNPLYALQMCSGYTEDEAASLIVDAQTAWEKLRTGIGKQDDFDTLAVALNVTLIRAESIGNGASIVADANNAIDAMIGVKTRYIRTGQIAFQFLPDNVDAINIAVDHYASITALSTPKVMIDALHESMRRMARASLDNLKEKT